MPGTFRYAIAATALSCLFTAGSAAFGEDAATESVLVPLNDYSWYAPDRAAKAARLILGRNVPELEADALYRQWTHSQLERWTEEHGPFDAASAYHRFRDADAIGARLLEDFPRTISPYGRVRSGEVDPDKARSAMSYHCPFCDARLNLRWQPSEPYRATTACGRTLHLHEPDEPGPYDVVPNETARVNMLDDTVREVATHVFTDDDGVEWELYIENVINTQRWQHAQDLLEQSIDTYIETGDPLEVFKAAALLDEFAQTYYGLPLAFNNEIATAPDGEPLTRADWEGLEHPPGLFEPSEIGTWNRRRPLFPRGWVALGGGSETFWVQPFARVRHHPAFREYSRQRYGDAEALEQRIMHKLMRESRRMFTSGVGHHMHALQANYQNANYTDLMLLGALLENERIYNFAAPNQEATLYNHHYHDGLSGEGAPNYMSMLGHYYRFMRDPDGWLAFDPDFLERNPFFEYASSEYRKLRTVRQLSLEFGDQHILAWPADVNRGAMATDEASVAENERLPSKNWPGFGIGMLRVGGPGFRQEVTLSYTKESMHGKGDKFGTSVWVDGVPVMRYGGYASRGLGRDIDPQRPEHQALLELGYPQPIAGAREDWTRRFASSPILQNNLTVNEIGTAAYRDAEGLAHVVTFKGGEHPDDLGARFQVLDATDHDSFKRVGVETQEYRRALLGVEGPDGRPYVVDITRVTGGHRHALFQHGWGDPAGTNLPPVRSEADNMAEYLEQLEPAPEFGDHETGIGGPLDRVFYEQLENVRALQAPDEPWDLTWKTDYAAYATRPLEGEFERPLPDDVGRVRLRLMGLDAADNTTLLRATGPWIARINQPLPDDRRLDGNVAFLHANDYLIEQRTGDPDAATPLASRFTRILEGFPESHESAIVAAEPLTPIDDHRRDAGSQAIRVRLAAGHTDTIVFQPEPGPVQFPNGLETDARYVLLRQDAAGRPIEAHMVRGTYLHFNDLALESVGDLTGKVVDLIGDLTGTRTQSALIIKPDDHWPHLDALAGRTIAVDVPNPRRNKTVETFTIESVASLDEGLIRVDLAGDPPFAKGWHNVVWIDPDAPNTLRTNRPILAGINTTWLWGNTAWFPEHDRAYNIRRTEGGTGGGGRVTVWLEEDADLVADGIGLDDWFVIHELRPGLAVHVPDHKTWRSDAE